MAHFGKSGRVVIDIDPDLKKQLYSTLSLSGSTLKEWFCKTAESFCHESVEPSLMFNGRNSTVEMVRGNGVLPKARRSKKTGPFKVVSLFSGCGGLDLGFKGGFSNLGEDYSPLPFEVVWANDLNKSACHTYRENIGAEIHEGDIWSVIDTLPSKADVVIGGFPCQDISVNGKRAGVNGKRSGLYRAMAEVIRLVKPSIFIAENVKALLQNEEWLNQVVAEFEGVGFDVTYDLYRAADFGVPQTRERVLIIGTKKGLPEFQKPAPVRSAANWVTAKEAIGDLEDRKLDKEFKHIWSMAAKSPEQGNRRLNPDRPGYTIRAECHGNIQFHYSLPRRISMREAARIQSFPDSFEFPSGLRETERQIGNAVPPVLGWHVGRAVADYLKTV